MHLDVQPHRPGPPGQIPNAPLRPAVDPPPPGPRHRPASRPSLPFSTRIPTGVRTDSGEERYFVSRASPEVVPHLPGSRGSHAFAGFPVVPRLFDRLHFVPEELMAF